MLRDIDTIFFDAGRTLLYAHPSIGDLYSRAAAQQGRRIGPEVIQAALAETLALRGPQPTGMEFWRRTVYETLERVGGVPDPEGCFQELWRLFGEPGVWRLYDDALETLVEIRRRGYKIGLLSNWDRRLRGIIAESDLRDCFDALIISDEVGFEKPSPEIFQTALDALGATASRAVHIGDSYRDDYEGAERMGIRPILIERDGSMPLSEGVTRIQSLKQLLQNTSCLHATF